MRKIIYHTNNSRKISAKYALEQSIQDIRVTKKRKFEVKERVVIPLEKKNTLTSDEKHVKMLRKKLKSIESLLKKEKNGDILDEQQLQKVGRLESLMIEMRAVSEKNALENK